MNAAVIDGPLQRIDHELDDERTGEHDDEPGREQAECARAERKEDRARSEKNCRQHAQADQKRPKASPREDRVRAISTREEYIELLTDPFMDPGDLIERECDAHRGKQPDRKHATPLRSMRIDEEHTI